MYKTAVPKILASIYYLYAICCLRALGFCVVWAVKYTPLSLVQLQLWFVALFPTGNLSVHL